MKTSLVLSTLFVALLAASAPCSPIHDAASKGDNAEIKRLLGKGVSVNAKDDNGRTPLHLAVEHTATAKLLIGLGALVETKEGTLGATPLHFAALVGNTDVVGLLIAKGAKVDARTTDNETPLILTAQNADIATAKLLISKGASVDAKDAGGRTSLHYAAYGGNTALAKFLIESGADVNAKTDAGATPRQLASAEGHAELVALLAYEECRSGSGPRITAKHSVAFPMTSALVIASLPPLSRKQETRLTGYDNDDPKSLGVSLYNERGYYTEWLKIPESKDDLNGLLWSSEVIRILRGAIPIGSDWISTKNGATFVRRGGNSLLLVDGDASYLTNSSVLPRTGPVAKADVLKQIKEYADGCLKKMRDFLEKAESKP